jgi:endonuclease/exonuclease/phosphatase family metal-dependent hydrolase
MQLRAIRQAADESIFPTIVLGDLNIERDVRVDPKKDTRKGLPQTTDEYSTMREILHLRDAYRVNSNLRDNLGHTYQDGPFARGMGIQVGQAEPNMTIDYILHDRRMRTIAASVADVFHLDSETPLSDHRPLTAEIEFLWHMVEATTR